MKETQQSNISELALAGSWLERDSALEYIPHLLVITLLKVSSIARNMLNF